MHPRSADSRASGKSRAPLAWLLHRRAPEGDKSVASKKVVRASGSAKATIDHDEIQEWVESHGGHPSMVKSTTRNGRGGLLRIDFPGFSGEDTLKEVSWPDFFKQFEESQLAFLYQDDSSGRPSRFNKFVARATVAEASEGRRAKPRAPRQAKQSAKTAPRAGSGRSGAKKAAKGSSTARTRKSPTSKGAKKTSARRTGQAISAPRRKSTRKTKARAGASP